VHSTQSDTRFLIFFVLMTQTLSPADKCADKPVLMHASTCLIAFGVLPCLLPGTDANVHINIFGDRGETGNILLDDPKK